MTAYGGLGGAWNGRPFDPEDPFEAAVARAPDLSDEELAEELAGALANRPWVHKNGDSAAYSMRASGDLICAVRRHQGHAAECENYVRWYLCGAAPVVTWRLVNAMGREGWRPLSDDDAERWYEQPDERAAVLRCEVGDITQLRDVVEDALARFDEPMSLLNGHERGERLADEIRAAAQQYLGVSSTPDIRPKPGS